MITGLLSRRGTPGPGLVPGLTARARAAVVRRFPPSAAEWARFYPGVSAVPAALWPFQDAASPVDDTIGAHDLAQNQALAYRVESDPEPTWQPRFAVETDTNNDANEWAGDADTAFSSLPAGAGRTLLLRFRAPDNGAAGRAIAGIGGAAARWGVLLNATTGTVSARASDGTTTVNATSLTAYDDGLWHDAAFVWDRTAGTPALRLFVDGETASANLGALSAVTATTGIRFGASVNLNSLAGVRVSYMAWFNAALSAADFAAFRAAV